MSPISRVPSRLIVSGIRIYQVARYNRPSPCRFVPSCSAYAIEAIETRGALRGSLLAIGRVGRCHPFGKRGFDPVPG
jgi:putative membrane protein insertion efficiency factor